MKETANMIRAGAMWVLFRTIALPMLKTIVELAEQSIGEAVRGTGKFTTHEFSGHLAKLKNVEKAILKADKAHAKVTKRLTKKGVEMCSSDEFADAYAKENEALEQEAVLRSGPRR